MTVDFASTSPTLAVVAEGDANTSDCWSGSGRSFVDALRAAGARVDVYDAELTSWRRAAAAALTYHPTRGRWQQRYGLGTVPFVARSARVNGLLGRTSRTYDAVIQIGATFATSGAARRGAPCIVYCDSNVAYSARGAPYSSASRLSREELESAFRREQRVYDAADRIWSMSDALATSFRDDFAQSPGKITTIYAGANNPPSPVPGARREPRILFIGKDHQRKGSAMLLQAFEIVRREVPDAELHLVGGIRANADRPGVVSHGFIACSTVAGRGQFDHLFATSSVFCLPSRYEPFGIAFVEAMRAGLPCIGSRAWAMPEIIDEGKTGWLVDDGSVEELAAVLIAALRDPAKCAAMGAAGRERSLERFTWEHVGARALADLRNLRSQAADESSWHQTNEAAHVQLHG
jgi:alpha-maltose-1-phosphate synthase